MELEPLPTQPDAHQLKIIEPLCAVFRRDLKAQGLKYTPERAAVLDIIIQLDNIFEAEVVLDRLKAEGHRVSKATVYRTIKLLQDSGIIQRVISDTDHTRYAMVYGSKPHDMLINIHTDELIEIDIPELIEIRDRICRDHNLEPQGHRLQIYAKAKG